LSFKLEPQAGVPAVPASQKKQHKSWVAWIAVLLAGALLYFSLRGLNWQVFWQTLTHLKYGFLPLFLITASINYFFRAVRWHILVSFEKPVRITDVFWANMAGYFGNSLLPARAGELIRAVYLGKLTGISSSLVLATGLVERLMDVLALVMIGAVSLAMTGITSTLLQSALYIMSLAGVAGLVFLLLLARFSQSAGRLIEKLPLLHSTQKSSLRNLLEQFARGIQSLARLRSVIGFVALTALIWLLDGLQLVGLAILFGFPLSLPRALVLLAGLGLSSAIPSTPGYIGVYPFVARTILGPFGINPETAIAFMLVSQVMGLLVVAVWGGISLWRFNRLDKSGDLTQTTSS
jgi:uncharacterized protein (TIRG00374 family)